MRLLLLILLINFPAWGQYTIALAGTPTNITQSTTEVDAFPALLEDNSGNVYLFYASSVNETLQAPTYISLLTSTVSRLSANLQDWTGNSNSSNCSGNYPAYCFAGDGTNIFGVSGTGVTPGGAIEVSYAVEGPGPTYTSMGAFYQRSANAGTTWSSPVAFSVTYPSTSYSAGGSNFVSVPSGQVAGSCSGGCVIKPIFLTPSGYLELVYSYDDGVTFTGESSLAFAQMAGEVSFGWSAPGNLFGFNRPAATSTGATPPGPINVQFMYSSNFASTWTSTCTITGANCQSPPEPSTLFNCAGFGLSNYIEMFPRPNLHPAPVGSGLSTLFFGDRLQCGSINLPSNFWLKALTFNVATALSVQTFPSVQVVLDLGSYGTGTQNDGNTTYCDEVPLTGANILVACEIPRSNPSAGCTTQCEQIWAFPMAYEQLASSTGGGGSLVGGGASIR